MACKSVRPTSFIAAILGIGLGLASPLYGVAQETKPGDEPIQAPAEKPATVEERLADEAAGPDGEKADLAYGAYQRGYYLTAFALALPKAQTGDPKAQTLIAELYDKGLGVARDPEEATAWYGIAAKNNDREAQFGYAVKLLEGRYVKKDIEEAKRLMKLAADSGHATAAFNFGQIIIDQKPNTGGIREALPYFEQAAKNRVVDAYYALAQIYRSGKLNGYPENQKAQDWLLLAAKGGIDTAQVELAIWLANGTAGTKEPEIAFAWMQRAANGGNVIARNRLAKMYAEGLGTKVDLVQAAKWHILAQRAGLNDSELDDFINSLDRKLLPKALEEANRFTSG